MTTVINEFDTVYAAPGKAIDDQGAEYEDIQTAIDNSDKWVLLGPGTYDQTVEIGSETKLIGPGATIRTEKTLNSGFIIDLNGVDSLVQGVNIFGESSSSQGGINVEGERCNIDDCDITGLNGTGVAVQSNSVPPNPPDNVSISGCSVRNAEVGINIDAPSATIDNCFVLGTQSTPINVDGSGSVVANSVVDSSNPLVSGSDYEGINISSGTVQSCTVKSADIGISISGSGVTVSDNNISVLEEDYEVLADNVRINPQGTTNTPSDVVNTSGLRTIVNGKYHPDSYPTLSLGGADQVISPDYPYPADVYEVEVDAGGSPSNVQGISDSGLKGEKVRIYHVGGETVTLEHNNGSASSPLINQGGGNFNLTANGELAEYIYDGFVWRELYRNIV